MFRLLQLNALVLIAGCATNPSQVVTPRCDLYDDCFNRDQVRSYTFLDRDTLVVEVGPGRCPYVLKVDGIDCRSQIVGPLAFYDNDRRICAVDNALLVTDLFVRNSPLDVCRIRDVRAVSEDELLERYASAGRISPLPPAGSGELQVEEGTEAADSSATDSTAEAGSPAGSEESLRQQH